MVAWRRVSRLVGCLCHLGRPLTAPLSRFSSLLRFNSRVHGLFDYLEDMDIFPMGIYHSNLPNSWKQKTLADWCNPVDVLRLVVAGKSFGTGVDRRQVRYVLVDGLGDDLEGTYQVSRCKFRRRSVEWCVWLREMVGSQSMGCVLCLSSAQTLVCACAVETRWEGDLGRGVVGSAWFCAWHDRPSRGLPETVSRPAAFCSSTRSICWHS